MLQKFFGFVFVPLLFCCLFLILPSCSWVQSPLPVIPSIETGIFTLPSEPHFSSIRVGGHTDGYALSADLMSTPGVVVSKLSQRVVPMLSLPKDIEEYQGVVVSLEEMGFGNNPVTYDQVVLWGLVNGLGVAPPYLAPYLRLQFMDQKNWSDKDPTDQYYPTSQFFVVSYPIDLQSGDEFKEVVFSVVRDDKYLAPNSDVGLHLIVQGLTPGGGDRYFYPHNPGKYDHNNNFLFVLPQ